MYRAGKKGHLTQIEIMSRIGVKRQTGEVYQPSPSSHQTVGIICLNRDIMSPGQGRSGGNQVCAYTKHQRRVTRAREVVVVWLLNPFPLALFRSYWRTGHFGRSWDMFRASTCKSEHRNRINELCGGWLRTLSTCLLWGLNDGCHNRSYFHHDSLPQAEI